MKPLIEIYTHIVHSSDATLTFETTGGVGQGVVGVENLVEANKCRLVSCYTWEDCFNSLMFLQWSLKQEECIGRVRKCPYLWYHVLHGQLTT